MSLAYLNNAKEIEDSLGNINKAVGQLKDKIKNTRKRMTCMAKPENPIRQISKLKHGIKNLWVTN